MKRFLYTLSTLLFIASILFADPYIVLADEGGGDIHGLEVEVNGYHVTLSNQNEWAKGENTVIVTIADKMGMPITDTEVEIMVAPKAAAGHGQSAAEGHSAPEVDGHAAEPTGHDSMPGMDMNEPTEQAAAHQTTSHDAPVHGQEEISDPIAMREADQHGMYIAETHLKDSGEHEVLVMFHINGKMIEAAFTVEIPGANSKHVVLWSFALINAALIASASFMKKQPIALKGAK